MTAGKHDATMVYLHWHCVRQALGEVLREHGPFQQCTTAGGAPIGSGVGGQNGVAAAANAFHRESLPDGRGLSNQAAGLSRRAIPCPHARIADQSRISEEGTLPSGFMGR
jgi:hypothetical protein